MPTVPLYATLADRLREQMLTGVIPPGGRLPPEQAIAQRHEVSRETVRKAIDLLVVEGLVAPRNGIGHFRVNTKPLVWRVSGPEYGPDTDMADGPTDNWSRSVRAQGHEPSQRIRVEVAYACPLVAERLHLPEGTPVAVRRRMRFVDGEPTSTADSFYPRDVVAGTEIELPGDVVPGVYAVFTRIGRPWVGGVDRVTSRPPTREEAEQLNIARGVSVIELARASFDPGGVPVRLTRFILRGDKHVLEYERNREM